MFTGIVEEIGRVVRFERKGEGAYITIQGPRVADGMEEGHSISVDGVCLTAVSPNRDEFSAEVSPETLKRSTLGSFRVGREINLERPVTPAKFMGGHIVQGHVDAMVKVVSFKRQGDQAELKVDIPRELGAYIVSKGSIALNGVSLTVAEIRGRIVSVALIPTTLKETNLGDCTVGSHLNLEVDIIGKYVKSFIDHK